MSTTTATTEISSNSNSSCRLLVCLNTLPFHDQRHFRNLFSYKELLRLSACSRSLRSSIRNDQLLWQALYHRDFLSGAHYAKEMEFVLWCIRTDVNNPCTSDKRADLLENVDWYNTYRRRVSTENNWRYGRCNTTRIDMEQDGRELNYNAETAYNSLVIVQQSRSDDTPSHYYSLEYLPHSNLRSSSNIKYSSTLSTSPNILSLGSGNETQYTHVSGDHYIAVSPRKIGSNTNYKVKIHSRKHGGLFTTFDAPARYRVTAVKGKWVLLVNRLQELTNDLLYVSDTMIFDIENNIMCSGSISDTWNAIRFYKTTNNTAIVYTARLVKDDNTDRIEWALYQFSSNNHVVQLRNGWFHLPMRMVDGWLIPYNSYDSHMLLKLHGYLDYDPYIMHSVASSGQSHTPRNCYTITDQHIPIPLLRAGYMYSRFSPKPVKVWTDLTYNDDQVLRLPGTTFIRNIIGDFYVFTVRDHNRIASRLLVNITTKEIIRQMEASSTRGYLEIDTMAGTIYRPFDSDVEIIHEYGEL